MNNRSSSSASGGCQRHDPGENDASKKDHGSADVMHGIGIGS